MEGDMVVTIPIISTIELTTIDLISSIEMKLKCRWGEYVLSLGKCCTRDVGVMNIFQSLCKWLYCLLASLRDNVSMDLIIESVCNIIEASDMDLTTICVKEVKPKYLTIALLFFELTKGVFCFYMTLDGPV